MTYFGVGDANDEDGDHVDDTERVAEDLWWSQKYDEDGELVMVMVLMTMEGW